ncbi:MAG: HlyC/CorC family transporter [Gemmatimonadales bacterium]|nr:HlyC/CorC family transporter [Gemmatimonadota bacterium]MBK7783195.1 HlyC/CorC family transporter [Gemmatimonadota bacterium]MBK9068755.1 HlyC/CorC family transporter [Gemmatimonadota bacterium]MBP6669574.1 HlyC/CorC family transporter [Gemmatimonadales bacterium]MBP9199980.1 HlyC/CorC family transporter [Gemmatimonadales bacterium]
MIWAVLAVGLGLAIFGAMAGTALVSLSRLELTRAVAGQLKGNAGSLDWLAQMEEYLGVTGILTALGMIIVGAALPAFFTGYTLAALALVLVLVVVPGVLLAGYFIPRWLVRPRAERLRSLVVPLLRLLASLVRLVLPARALPGASELRAVWREGAAIGLAKDDELLMVGGVMTFTERPAREVMTPRTELVAVAEHDALEDIAAVFAQSGYSRLPVYRGTLDEIVGMLHAFDLFRLRPGDQLPIRPVANAPATRTCGDLLLDMQRERRHLAVVLDEFGGTQGIVTLEDLLEELVGEIFDEHDPAPEADAAGPLLFETDGGTPVSAIEERFELRLPEVRVSTAGGLLAELAGRIPQAGERFLVRGLEFEVVQASPTRVDRVLIRRGAAPPIVLSPPVAGGGRA